MPPKRGKKGSQAENGQKEPIAKKPRLSKSSRTAESKEKKRRDVTPTTRRTRSTKPGSKQNSEPLPSAPLSPEIRVVQRADAPTPERAALTAAGHSVPPGATKPPGPRIIEEVLLQSPLFALPTSTATMPRGSRMAKDASSQAALFAPPTSIDTMQRRSRVAEDTSTQAALFAPPTSIATMPRGSRVAEDASTQAALPAPSTSTTGVPPRPTETPIRVASSAPTAFAAGEDDFMQPTEYENYVDDGRAFASSTKNPVSGITSESASNSGDQFARFMSVFTTTLEAFRDTTLNAESSRMRNKLLPAKKLPEFTGNPCEWINFKNTYDWTSKAGNFTDSENVTRLNEAIKGEARDAVSSLFATGQDAAYIIQTLELYYGRKEVIADKILNEIENLPDLNSGKITLPKFASKIKNAVLAFKNFNLVENLQNIHLARKIGNKLPSALKYTYNLHASLVPSNTTALEKLSDFLEIQAKLAIDGRIFETETPEPSPAPSKPEKAPSRAKPAKAYTVVHQDDSSQPKSEKQAAVCVVCNRDNHKPANCYTLARENIQRRWFLVRKLRLCYKCLNVGHLSDNCKSKGCTLCSKPHHTLLHNQERPKNDTDKKRSERTDKSAPQQTNDRSVNQA